jgi:hypothetical protein
MRPAQGITFALVTLLVVGSLGANLGYAWYLRSDRYRKNCASYLSRTLGLPSDIGAVVPRSLEARQFNDVAVWLPDRRDRALTCKRAIVRDLASEDDRSAYELELLGGTCEISTRTWLRDDYRNVLTSGLRTGFAPDGPRRVTFGNLDVLFARNGFRAELQNAGGSVEFESRTLGRAAAVCQSFNGHRTQEPVVLTARFSPVGSGVRVDRAELEVPTVPLEASRLEHLTGLPLRTGSFAGRLLYRESDAGRILEVSGRCADLNLAEFTGHVRPSPWRGVLPNVTLQELRVVDDRPVAVRFRGDLADLCLGDVLASFGLEDVGGSAQLSIRSARVSADGIERFEAAGHCRNVSLDALSAALGYGRVTGTFGARIDELRIEDNRLAALDATLRVDDALDKPNWVETVVLREVVRRTLGFDLPEFLPERIEYSRLGVRLFVRDEQLNVFGTHGQGDRVILTAHVYGQDLPVVREPRRSFDLRPVLDMIRARAHDAWEDHAPFGSVSHEP